MASLFKDVETLVDLHTIPLFHANGWGRPQASTLLGVKQIMVRRFDPTGVFRLIQEHHATDMSLVPTMANALLNAPDLAKFDVSSMRNIMLGGAASSPELIERMEKAFHCDVYAATGSPKPRRCSPRPGTSRAWSTNPTRSAIDAAPWRDGPFRAFSCAWSIRI